MKALNDAVQYNLVQEQHQINVKEPIPEGIAQIGRVYVLLDS